MELKNYQKAVIRDLERYLEILMQTKNIETAYTRLWQEKDVKVGFGGMPKYQNLLPGVPNVCLKVPTGGGKTFLAANAIEPILSALGVVKRRAVVWLVPSDAILTQTLAALRDPAHPYRQKIDVAFGSRVEVYTKEQLLMGSTSIFLRSTSSFPSWCCLTIRSVARRNSSRPSRRTAALLRWQMHWANPICRWKIPTRPP